ncbi:MAG: protein kinase, partial [Proteobacteria bacterium]|nr:protein kinase [Pseudomonadota bacterium]
MMTESSPDISNTGKSLTEVQPLEGYSILREIGHGTQGRVFLAERESDHTYVAIKRLDIESVKNWKEYELFHREVQVLEKLNIDGVAKFWDAIECLDADPPCSYLVQEYIPGRSLNEMLRAGHHFSLDRVYQIVIQLLEILRQLQSYNPPVIHRDIKPSNIMLKPLEGDQYKVYLIDFGAVANPQVQSGGSTVAGTFGYMPPEQLMGKPIPASDIYSLAAVAVYMLCGVSPADIPTKDFYLIFEPYLQNMPHALVQTLRQMLEPDTEKRLCDIDQLISTFTSFMDGQYANYTTIAHNDATFNARLKEVSSYCANGNIDLWQQLPEEKPRSIPLSYNAVMREYISKRSYLNPDGETQRIRKSFNTLTKDKPGTEDDSVKRKKVIVEVPFGEFVGYIIIFLLGLSIALFSSDEDRIVIGGGVILVSIIAFAIHVLVLKSMYKKKFSSMDEFSSNVIDSSTSDDMINYYKE